jgi:hypothetical protein
MTKFALTFAVGLAAVSSFAQTLTPSEQEVNIAFNTLRGVDKVLFRLQGNEYFGPSTIPIATDLFWDRPVPSSGQDMRFEMLEARNSILTSRVVGDGRHMWGIDLLRNTYSASRYGSYTAAKPADYEVNGLQSFNLLSTGQSAWIARMTREIWGGTVAQYRPWIPASSLRSEQSVQGGATFPDPVVPTRVYNSSLTKEFFVYWTKKGGVPTRSLTFELDLNAATSNYDLSAIYFTDVSTVGATSRMVDWKTTVFTGVLPSTGNFVYNPPAGARAVAGPRPNGGG